MMKLVLENIMNSYPVGLQSLVKAIIQKDEAEKVGRNKIIFELVSVSKNHLFYLLYMKWKIISGIKQSNSI